MYSGALVKMTLGVTSTVSVRPMSSLIMTTSVTRGVSVTVTVSVIEAISVMVQLVVIGASITWSSQLNTGNNTRQANEITGVNGISAVGSGRPMLMGVAVVVISGVPVGVNVAFSVAVGVRVSVNLGVLVGVIVAVIVAVAVPFGVAVIKGAAWTRPSTCALRNPIMSNHDVTTMIPIPAS